MSAAAQLVRTIRPYGLHLSLLAYTPALLFADGVTEGVAPQVALGALTFCVLWAASRRVDPARRWEVWLCVPIATGFEVFGSLIWGGYTYELGNIPLYVPPGHAKNWGKHCGRYNACGRPVYFVKEEWVQEEYQRSRGGKGHGKDKGHGNGKGNGKGKDKD